VRARRVLLNKRSGNGPPELALPLDVPSARVLTSVVLSAQGAFELEVRQDRVGLLLLAVSVMVRGLGAAADPYMPSSNAGARRRG